MTSLRIERLRRGNINQERPAPAVGLSHGAGKILARIGGQLDSIAADAHYEDAILTESDLSRRSLAHFLRFRRRSAQSLPQEAGPHFRPDAQFRMATRRDALGGTSGDITRNRWPSAAAAY